MQISNVQTVDGSTAQMQWLAFTVADGGGTQSLNMVMGEPVNQTVGATGISTLDSARLVDYPATFTAFSVYDAMQDAFIDSQVLDPVTARFTKRRSAANEVVLCFRQSVATPAGQTLTVNLPEGFRIMWQDSNDCLKPDSRIGVPPVEIRMPFGNVSYDDSIFTTLPEGTQVLCASSIDGSVAYLTLSTGLVEIARTYVIRLAVKNAERSPASNYWRLSLGQQASKPIPGFTMQAFTRLELVTSVTSAAQAQGSGPANIMRIMFRPSMPVPIGGAVWIKPPGGFELVSSVPRTTRGLLVAANSRCLGTSLFLGTDYSYEQCEETCRQRPSCLYFSVGFGTNAGECIQEGSVANGAPTPCLNLEPHPFFSVFRLVPTGNCFRYELRENSVLRRDVDCSLETGTAVLRLPFSAPAALGVEYLYSATIAVRNPTIPPPQNTWSVQSFTQASLSQASLLDDGLLDGFLLTPALASFSYSTGPANLKNTVGAEVTMTFNWAPRVELLTGADKLQIAAPAWLGFPSDTCTSLRALPLSGVATTTTNCQVVSNPHGIEFLVESDINTLPAGTPLDFEFKAHNPNVSVARNLSLDEVSMITLTHLRPVVSAVTGQIIFLPLASAAAPAHAVHLPLLRLEVRQVLPQFAITQYRPITLEIDFMLQSSGADQVWVGSSMNNPLDFSSVRCFVTELEHQQQQQGSSSQVLKHQ